MVKITPDQALIGSRETDNNGHTAFTKKVMRHITPKKSHTFFTQLQRMPRMAFAIAVLVMFVLISGTAYAAYQLWLNPSAKVQQLTQNQYGRQEALVEFENCKDSANATYEVKSSESLNAEQVGQLLQAKCELDTINDWANSSWPSIPQKSTMVYPGAFTVTQIAGDSVSLTGTHDNPNLTLTDKVIIVVDGKPTNKNALQVGDTVTHIQSHTYGPNYGSPTSSELLALVKLQQPVEFYEPAYQNRVAERVPCMGNSADTCVQNGLIDVYPRDGENSAFVIKGDIYEIQGRVVEHNGNTIRIKGSSGAIYAITAPSDVINTFNTKYSANYEGTKINVGDMLYVRYSQESKDDHKNVQPKEIQSVALMIELVKKTDGLKKY